MAEFDDGKLASLTPLEVPLFQPMQVIRGDLSQIQATLETLSVDDNVPPVWLCIEVETQDYLNDLQQRIQVMTEDLHVEVLQLRRSRANRQSQIERQEKETLAELTPEEVFERRLSQELFSSEEDQQRLTRIRSTFNAILAEVNTPDDHPIKLDVTGSQA